LLLFCQQGIVHCDLASRNVLVVEDRNSPIGVRLKITDFGLAEKIFSPSQPRVQKPQAGKVAFRHAAPETLENHGTVVVNANCSLV
jgi:serine/threonine protein kinase